jgi:hypothetical protein
VPLAERVDVEKGERLLGFEELEAGDIACCRTAVSYLLPGSRSSGSLD